MKLETPLLIKASRSILLFLIISASSLSDALANIESRSIHDKPPKPQELVLNSKGFTAQERSSFSMGGQTEQNGRGLTLIHFHTSQEFEFRTFDTHGSEVAAAEFLNVLQQLQTKKAVFALLVHDSAAKSLVGQSEKLTGLGFSQLALLKSRQAYIMHNFDGKIYEKVDDIGITETFDVPINITDEQVYFPKVSYEFEPNNDRYIAHAGGEVNGIRSTNTKDALDQNYAKGFRIFELDIVETADGKLVAAHDWGMWSRFTDYGGTLPPTHAEFMKEKIYGDYTTLDMEGINAWFTAHADATLVTDKVNDPIAFSNAFVDKSRLIMELFSVMAVEQASQHGINTMMSHKPFFGMKGDKLNFLAVNNVKYVALSRRAIEKNKELMLQLKEQGVKVYVYHVNFDEGKDEKYVQENEIGIVYGMYADKWVFDPDTNEKPSK
ncbi:hypothetical protein [Pricia sp.]|uniref:hypothetical protein n=1 Tax=Pricia sp. TaxID=2268138 RepID=UPI0035943F43